MEKVSLEAFLKIKESLLKSGMLEINVSGSSMYPLFPKDKSEKVKIYPVNKPSELRQFDVITFWKDGFLVTHYFWKPYLFSKNTSSPDYITRPLNPLRSYDTTPLSPDKILGIIPGKRLSAYHKFRIFLANLRK